MYSKYLVNWWQHKFARKSSCRWSLNRWKKIDHLSFFAAFASANLTLTLKKHRYIGGMFILVHTVIFCNTVLLYFIEKVMNELKLYITTLNKKHFIFYKSWNKHKLYLRIILWAFQWNNYDCSCTSKETDITDNPNTSRWNIDPSWNPRVVYGTLSPGKHSLSNHGCCLHH